MAKRAPSSDETFPPPPFEGFAAPAFAFFGALAINNEKTWFDAHKADYDRHVKGPMLSLVSEVSARLKSARVPLTGDPQKALFRINRDVRFSANKNPYKTHAGAVLTADGRKGAPGLLYIHFDPVRSFTAAGFFRVEPPVLQKLRKGLVADPVDWTKVERALTKSKLALAVDEPLVRLPKGFETAPAAVVETLKLKSWIVRRELPQSRLGNPKLVDDIVAFAIEARPLLDFGWAALAR
jgi:uncharacterized protein (TIGR02453 family)